MSTATIAVGSNLGNKRENCIRGINTLGRTPGTKVTARARFYKTAPVDFTDQDWFVNTAVRIETDLDPEDLLARLKEIEAMTGRAKSGIRFGPRVLDMDIIFYDRLVFNSGALEIPHPRMHKRRFVLSPICDIDPTAMHPVLLKPVQTLLESITDPDQAVTVLT